MTHQRERKSIFNSLKNLRLQIAHAILRNASDIVPPHADIERIEQAEELCDEYALRALIVWFSTKYGSTVCTPSIKAEQTEERFWLCKLLAETRQFPFCNQPVFTDYQTFIELCQAAFSADLQPGLEVIGNLYEQIVNFPIRIQTGGLIEIPTNIQSKDDRRRVGQFYTPPWAVDYCLAGALGKDSAHLMNAVKANIQYTVLDPSCGTGNFLIGALRMLQNGQSNDYSLGECTGVEQRLRFVAEALYGFELDGRAAALTRISLLLAVLPDLSFVSRNRGIECARDEALMILTALRKNVVVNDSVLSGSLCKSGDFDLVITNPPYISFGARNQPTLSPSCSKFLKTSFPESAEYKVRIHSIFQEIALRYTKEGGQAVLLVPDGFLTGCYYTRLRQLLLRQSRLKSFSELPDDTVPSAVVGRWCAAVYCKDSSPTKDDYEVELSSLLAGAQSIGRYRLPLSLLVSKDKSRLRLLFNDVDRSIVSLIDQLPPLRDVMRGHTGIRAIAGQAGIIDTTRRGPMWQKGIRSGAQVDAFVTKWDGVWICIDPQMLYKGGFDKAIVENPKLLVRQTADRLIAGFDDSGLYHLNNVHSFSPIVDDIDIHCLDGLFNSSFWLYVYRLKTREDGRALAQIDIETVESLPLPQRDFDKEKQLAQLSKTLTDRKALLSLDLISFIERSIDALVYDLYGLSRKQILHIETDLISGRRIRDFGVLPTEEEIAAFLSAREVLTAGKGVD